jgi:alpha-tubulin suppressor-like RCC1 family protein
MFFWGRQPQCSKNPSSLIQFNKDFIHLKLLNQKIHKTTLGENHLIMMDAKDQVHGFGDNRFHQLDGNLGHLDDPVALSFNQKLRVEKIYLGCDFSFLLDKDFNVRC